MRLAALADFRQRGVSKERTENERSEISSLLPERWSGSVLLHEFPQRRPFILLDVHELHPHHIAVIRCCAGRGMRFI